MKNSCYLLNRVFLFALFALLFNDWYLKASFPSFLSGKLSDLCGLVVFVLFFTFLLGDRFKLIILIATTLLFCWWKSYFSSGFIQNWNEFLPVYSIERTIDYTDLFCLLVFIPVYFYHPRKISPPIESRWATAPVLLFTVFAIAATSKAKRVEAYSTSVKYSIQKSFKLKMTHAAFLQNLSFSNITFEKSENAEPPKKPSDPHEYILKNFTIRDGLTVEAMYISVKEKNKRIILSIHSINLIDPPAGTTKEIREMIVDEARKLFEMES